MEMFSGEDSENSLDDWLPALVRAAEWNKWTKDELLIHLLLHSLIFGVDIMELPVTARGNRYVIDFLTKWSLVFPVPDQKAIRIA